MIYDEIVVQITKFFKPGNIQNKNKSNRDIDTFSYWDELLKVANEYPDCKSIYIEFRHIESFDVDLAETLLNNPSEWLRAAKDAILEIDLPITKTLTDLEVRVTGLHEPYEIEISKLRNIHIEKFIAIRCAISKASEVRPAYEVVAFECLRCGYITKVKQSTDSDNLVEPFQCEDSTCGKKGPFRRLDKESKTYNHQYLKIQEPLENLRGRQPEFLYVSCSEDLAGMRKPGEKVIITGVLKSRIKVKKEGQTKFLDFLFVANSILLSDKDYENIEITSKDEEDIKELSKKLDIKNIIIASIAPSIYGHENIKEGIALQLFSGNSIDLPDGTHKRGDIHILMVGDPGVAKSQFLKFVAGFAPRAIQVSGRSTSAAGLTGAAVHDDFDGKWAIEAGALTMAGEGGVCCVDEMDKMKEHDRGSIHDALEQQYVNVAKAGVFAQLPTRCALLGAANPKYGRYDKYEGIAEQFNLGAALLSRMDLLYVMRDIPNVEKDKTLAWHVLDDEYDTDEIIDLELLRKYMAYSKTHCNPKMTKEAKTLIVNFFVETRRTAGEKKEMNIVPVTVRALEASKRLAVANAKLRLSDVVTKYDAEEAIRLLLENLREVGIDPDTGQLDAAIIESGTSGSQRTKIRKLKEIIDVLCKQNMGRNEARIEDIELECEKQKISDPITLISKMKEKGDLLAVTQTSFRTVYK
jgi:replicative DNA helicase Mcm